MHVRVNLTKAKPKGRRVLSVLPGVFMVALLALGGLAALVSLATYDFPSETVLDGAWTAAYENRFDEGLPFRPLATAAVSAIAYSFFGVGLEGVLIGQGGWLFTAEEFSYYPYEAAETAFKLALVKEVQARLAAKGAALVVALVPAKARVYEESLGRYRLPDYSRARYEAFRKGLNASGVVAPDLFTPLLEAKAQGEVFLKTDTHWTPFGAAVAAGALAKATSTVEGLELHREAFETVQEGVTRYLGDLLSFIPLGVLQDRLGPQPDTLPRLTTREISSSLGNALFGDMTIPVVLVGTSYSASGVWNFRGALQQSLGLSVLNAAQEGLGPIVPMLRYLDNPAFIETPPELVIWEIPERYLPVSYDLTSYGLTGCDKTDCDKTDCDRTGCGLTREGPGD
jgi:alginate O-acetyltransferase complex protein AlgJ